MIFDYVTKTFGFCYQNVWTMLYHYVMLPKRLDYIISTIMLPKRLNYVISTILCYQNVWIMLPKRLNYVTKTFELCYQNV